MLQRIAIVELGLGWSVWFLAFLASRRWISNYRQIIGSSTSRWGILLTFIGLACLFAYLRPRGFEKTDAEFIASMVLCLPSAVLAWAAVQILSKQRREEAQSNKRPALIRTWPYSAVRHPICTAMLGMAIATAVGWTWWPMMIAGLFFCLLGLEAWVYADDQMLANVFQDEYAEYQSTVRGFIPMIR